MRKTVLFFLLFTLILFSCTGCNSVKYSADTNSANSDIQTPSSSTDRSTDSTTELKTTNTSASSTTVSTSSPTEYAVYDIFGASNKLSKESATSMQKWRIEAKNFGKKYPFEVLLNGQPQNNMVYLTFDDGPDNVITPKVVDILAQNNVCGNFFLVGENIEKYKEVVKKAYDNKNYIGSHCFSHTKLTSMSTEQVKKEITDTNTILKNITGVAPSFIRPPYGDINDSVIADFKSLNLKIVLWSIDTLDWSQKDASNIVKNVTDHLRPGDIILMHCNSDKPETAKALPQVIQAIKNKGYKMGTFNQFPQE